MARMKFLCDADRCIERNAITPIQQLIVNWSAFVATSEGIDILSPASTCLPAEMMQYPTSRNAVGQKPRSAWPGFRLSSKSLPGGMQSRLNLRLFAGRVALRRGRGDLGAGCRATILGPVTMDAMVGTLCATVICRQPLKLPKVRRPSPRRAA
jgi:hypothetical protein